MHWTFSIRKGPWSIEPNLTLCLEKQDFDPIQREKPSLDDHESDVDPIQRFMRYTTDILRNFNKVFRAKIKKTSSSPFPVVYLKKSRQGAFLTWRRAARVRSLPEEESPGCVPLLCALLLGVLLTLGDGVHHVIAPATQARHLAQSYKIQGNFLHENWRESNFVLSTSGSFRRTLLS